MLALGSLSTRADLIRLSAGVGKEFAANNKLQHLLSIIAGAAYTSVIIWGFLNLKWYVALLLFIGFSIGMGFVVNRSTIKNFLMVKPIIEVITITTAIFIWIL